MRFFACSVPINQLVTISHKHASKDEDKKDSSVPAWKKQAVEGDPMAAPFGGSWNAESNVSAKDHHGSSSNTMEEG